MRVRACSWLGGGAFERVDDQNNTDLYKCTQRDHWEIQQNGEFTMAQPIYMTLIARRREERPVNPIKLSRGASYGHTQFCFVHASCHH